MFLAHHGATLQVTDLTVTWTPAVPGGTRADQNPTESGGRELQHMTKTKETGIPDMGFQAGYNSAAAFSVKNLTAQFIHGQTWATQAGIAPKRVMFTKLALSRRISKKTGNVYEQWKASSSSCSFSFCILSYILTQICSSHFIYDLLTSSCGLSLNPDLQHLLLHFSSCQQQVPISCKIHTIAEGSQELRVAVPLLTPCHTFTRMSSSGENSELAIPALDTDFCSLERRLSPRLAKMWKAAGAMTEH